MIKTKNPFQNKNELSYLAWKIGYNSLDLEVNPYFIDAAPLHCSWEDGRQAKLIDIKNIPNGSYCYGSKGKCSYWYSKDRQVGGCSFIDAYDDDGSEKATLLWDQVKECGLKIEDND